MKETGADVYGLEFSEDSAKQCIENSLNVSTGFIEKSDSILSNAPYDAFFILNFLEHLPDPNSLLRGMYNNLKKDGIGLVEVPNFDMILRNNLFSEFTSDHLLYFTKETLSSALILNGFEIVECNEIWHDYIISAVVRKREKLDISHFNCFENQKVGIWGAGHQALAVIAMANLSGKIKYILDSATFKQGKYSPATHIPIVAPQTLGSDPVDAVIVMAASYSDEVAKIIKEKYNRNIKIAILRDFGLEFI
jgi:SAM-dependent methyltransferase